MSARLKILPTMRGAATAAFAALSLCIVLAAALAEAILPRIHIAERGIYRAETIQRGDPNEKGAIINTVQSARLITSTTSILAEVGVRFGLRYIATVSTELGLVIRFPPGGLRDPATQQISFQSEFMVVPSAGVTNYWEYHFENDWEVAPGVWTFEFWQRGRKLAEQHFCVHEKGKPLSQNTMMKCGAALFLQ